MKKTFTKEYYLANRGCYERSKMLNLVENNAHETIEDFLNWDIPIKDKFFFVRSYCNLTLRDKQDMALMCAKVSLVIYENKYPNDSRIRDCINATELYLKGKISIEEFKEKKNAADAAAAAYDAAADAAAAAADAAAYAAAADAAAYDAAADAAAYAAAAAADAADAAAWAADKCNHTKILLNALKDFCENLPISE